MIRSLVLIAVTFAVVVAPVAYSQQKSSAQHPVPKVISLDKNVTDYMPILKGPPETSTMRSGLVVLAQQKTVGKHSTDNFEELVIILEGRAEMRITGGKTYPLKKGEVMYCPTLTEHDVINVGSDTLRYIYVVSETKKQ